MQVELDELAKLIVEKRWNHFHENYFTGRDLSTALKEWVQAFPVANRGIALPLLRNFLLVKDYSGHAAKLNRVLLESFGSSLAVFPVQDFSKNAVKSGHAIHYEMSSQKWTLREKDVIWADNPIKYSNISTREVIFVDDFIGTGHQFQKMVRFIQKKRKLSIRAILSIAAQDEAIERIEALGISVHTLYRRKRASEVLREAENISEDIFYQNYDAVEAILKCTEQYRRGFLGSEALVSLKRTPNNTLSIFWYEGKEKNWPAPFPRN